jgi:hypothetical protein
MAGLRTRGGQAAGAASLDAGAAHESNVEPASKALCVWGRGYMIQERDEMRRDGNTLAGGLSFAVQGLTA